MGGAAAIRSAFEAGLVDVLSLHLAPVFVGSAMDASMLVMPQLVRLGRHARHHADQQRLGLALLAAAVSVRGTELMMRAGIGPYAARVPAGDTAGIFASPMGRA
ncbi:hypothetical protein [Streptomyces albidoflavus]|uniref:hypothetical protein n=1 Tax=Streptomyces albidoflavus TaxID=1886 RepID=UPI00380F62AD